MTSIINFSSIFNCIPLRSEFILTFFLLLLTIKKTFCLWQRAHQTECFSSSLRLVYKTFFFLLSHLTSSSINQSAIDISMPALHIYGFILLQIYLYCINDIPFCLFDNNPSLLSIPPLITFLRFRCGMSALKEFFLHARYRKNH